MSDAPGKQYEPIIVSNENTVVNEYISSAPTETAYQSEAELERAFMNLLEKQAYEKLTITKENQLKDNLRTQLQKLNNYFFTDREWDTFFKENISSSSDGIIEKTTRIQEDNIQILEREDGSTKNITLIDKENIHNNHLQVLSQYEVNTKEGANYSNRYDVTILVNGFPLVHVELKRRGVHLREAFNQIQRYQRDSFWVGSGLFEYVQLFVISNGTLTKYYSNTTRERHLKNEKANSNTTQKTSNSFEFTSWWADAKNKPIKDLTSFTRTFFVKHTLLNILTKYCVFTEDRSLLVMRPYQIVATEQILQKIVISNNNKSMLGKPEGGGYVWHTTGSGKTLTSFKAARLASKLKDVDKVLFVVDRKDLDYQTMKEYDRFEKGSADSSTSTRILKELLEKPDARIIVTTIQKLANFVSRNKNHAVYKQRVVLIFDECHRSQFGSMHKDVTRAFKNYNLFGFTGTPIFKTNAYSSNSAARTTQEIFGDKLHTYTIVNAINDQNVLKFRIDYINTIKKGDVEDKEVVKIASEKALLAPERIEKVVKYTLENFGRKTKRNIHYVFKNKKVQGFNALFATASIDAAMKYYNEFKKQQAFIPVDERLKVGVIFSYGANDAVVDDIIEDEGFEPGKLPEDARSFLDGAIKDYNTMYSTNFDTSAEKFQNYYKDLSKKLKERDIDLVIVVNMFLTGFDSTTLNTLFIDKKLQTHGLIQAYSRTNRILNSVKAYGNIVSFRNLEMETDEAIALFGDENAKGITLLKPYKDYHEKYVEKAKELLTNFPSSESPVGESKQKEYVMLFSDILRLRNILDVFDEFVDDETLNDREMQDYQSHYLEIRETLQNSDTSESESIIDDLIFEVELIKQVEINIDYILLKVQANSQKLIAGDVETRKEVMRAVNSSPNLRNKSDLVESFVNSLTMSSPVGEQWEAFISEKRAIELDEIIKEEKLKAEKIKALVNVALVEGTIPQTGTAIAEATTSITRFGGNSLRDETITRVKKKLQSFVERFSTLGGN